MLDIPSFVSGALNDTRCSNCSSFHSSLQEPKITNSENRKIVICNFFISFCLMVMEPELHPILILLIIICPSRVLGKALITFQLTMANRPKPHLVGKSSFKCPHRYRLMEKIPL